MQYYYSPSVKGFFNDDIHGINIPLDCVKITEEEHKTFLKGLSIGKKLKVENGAVFLTDPPPPNNEKLILIASNKIKDKIDLFAKSWGYTDIVSAVSYINSTNSQFSLEANLLNKWRDDVWNFAINKFSSLNNSIDVDNLLNNLPKEPEKNK